MSSNITINISTQSGDEEMMTKKRESADTIPAPPDAGDTTFSEERPDSSDRSVPAPPQDAISESDPVSDQPAAPPKFMGETSDSSTGEAGIAPVPPSDHPDTSDENKNNNSKKKSSDAPPPADDDNEEKDKSDKKKKKK